jgi:heat shock protein HslJ
MSIRTITACISVSALAVLAGCTTPPQNTLATIPDAARSVASKQELSGNWTVYAIGNRSLSGPHSPRIAFDDDERVGGIAGCNRFLGGYRLDSNGDLSFGEMRLTRRICPEPIMFQEALLLSRLRDVDRSLITPGGDLLLYYDEDELPIRLQRDARIHLQDPQTSIRSDGLAHAG